jgi:hypothetical protein
MRKNVDPPRFIGVGVSLRSDQVEQLRIFAALYGKSRSAVIRDIVDLFLQDELVGAELTLQVANQVPQTVIDSLTKQIKWLEIEVANLRMELTDRSLE